MFKIQGCQGNGMAVALVVQAIDTFTIIYFGNTQNLHLKMPIYLIIVTGMMPNKQIFFNKN